MDIAIIGAGNVGRALAHSLTQAGHRVTLTARDPEHARSVAAEVGGVAVVTNAEAARAAQVVVIAVPFVGAAAEVAAEIRDAVDGKTVIDVSNPIRPDYSGLAVEGTSAAEELQRWLPEAIVVKAFNTLFASNQASPGQGAQVFVAADAAEAKETVMLLAGSMGFSPLDVGSLSAARTLEAMAFLNISLNAANGWDWTSAWKLER
jgi:8-hydroxy-5-deazaflavin:NADPH oxidoreductase